MCSWSCWPPSPAVDSEAGQTHVQMKDDIALQRMRQDTSDTQLYRAMGLSLCSGKVSFRLFHPLLVELSNLTNNNSLCFFPKLQQLLRPLQCSRHQHLCPVSSLLYWLSLLCAETTRSLMLVTLPVWRSPGLTGMCSRVNVAGCTVMRH